MCGLLKENSVFEKIYDSSQLSLRFRFQVGLNQSTSCHLLSMYYCIRMKTESFNAKCITSTCSHEPAIKNMTPQRKRPILRSQIANLHYVQPVKDQRRAWHAWQKGRRPIFLFNELSNFRWISDETLVGWNREFAAQHMRIEAQKLSL